ncbi:Lysine-specific demethylase 5A [Homalodisca vitripennis]|nr:Lysine-specific demethylase 5A [Homalodisca vitripennis]
MRILPPSRTIDPEAMLSAVSRGALDVPSLGALAGSDMVVLLRLVVKVICTVLLSFKTRSLVEQYCFVLWNCKFVFSSSISSVLSVNVRTVSSAYITRVPTNLVEKEFWRIVSSIEEDVTVEYGADLHTMDHGSGFPTKQTVTNKSSSDTKKYAESSWNLNNLPVLEGSVLGHINADISGMKVPWMYVGMCFATFCWHNEDHWSYSINYLHWGEPKTWYGVPGCKAEIFETAMKSAAPELFQSQPDLLHQLVTIMNPNVLMESGVPVYRTDQHAGEFVITFPRAYHAGFNQGYNFAEAVNFAPADWMKMGRECINHYSTLHRFCVFSHDELVCKMAVQPENLDLRIAASTYHDMLVMVDTEKKLRKTLLDAGVVKAEREAFELLPDDERQCEHCKTTCFLSAVTCTCSPNMLVCPKHLANLCQCTNNKNKTMRYRYTLDELPVMIQKLKLKAESFDKWVASVKNALDENVPTTLDLDDLKGLLAEAEEKKFPDSELLQGLSLAIQEAEKCASVAQQLDNSRMRTRTRLAHDNRCKLTVEELTLFHEQIQELACKIKEEELIRSLLEKVLEFQEEANKLLSRDIVESKVLESVIETGFFLNIDLVELPSLKEKLEQMKWLEEVKLIREDNEQMTIEAIRELIESAELIIPFPELEHNMKELQELLVKMEQWEIKAQRCLEIKEMQEIKTWEDLLEEANGINAHLPSKAAIKEILKKAKDWISKAESAITVEGHFPYMEVVEDLVNRGQQQLVRTEQLPKLEEMLNSAVVWRERASRVFLRKNTPYTLMETLIPRPELGLAMLRQKKKGKDSTLPCCISGVKLQGSIDPASVVAAFKPSPPRPFCEVEIHAIKWIPANCNLPSPPRPFSRPFCEVEIHAIKWTPAHCGRPGTAQPTPAFFCEVEIHAIKGIPANCDLPSPVRTVRTARPGLERLGPYGTRRADLGRAGLGRAGRSGRRGELIQYKVDGTDKKCNGHRQDSNLRSISQTHQRLRPLGHRHSLSPVEERAEKAELEAMLLLREENELKKRVNSLDSKFCICRKPLNGNMNECALCKDWFHVSCVPLMKGVVRTCNTTIGEKAKPITYLNETKFLCPICMRSRRPRLDTILTLLVSLQSLPVRLPEGEALQCLTERAMGWQSVINL